MEISLESSGGVPIVSLDGRLDAFGAQQLETALPDLVPDADSGLVIDMTGVPYLSSAGLRVLLATDRKLRRKNGRVHLCNVSSYPLSVLKMAGFDQVFAIHVGKREALRACAASREMTQAGGDAQTLSRHRKRGCQLTVFQASTDEAVLAVAGDMSKVLYARLREDDILSRRFSDTEYSIGLGALGENVHDCIELLGEMITIGGTMVWLPTDGNDTADFLIPRVDTGEVRIRTGFNVALSGPFNDIVVVEREESPGLTIADLYSSLFEIARETRPAFRGLMSIALRAEVEEVYSSGVKISPIALLAPENGEMIMSPDNIDRWMDIKTEPRHRGETMVSFGAGIDLGADLSVFEKGSLDNLFYLHPANVGAKTMLLHNHGVVFGRLPWHKSLDLDDDIRQIVNQGAFLDMRHLLDNTKLARAVAGVSYISGVVFER